jgi:SulP family sulfate permease
MTGARSLQGSQASMTAVALMIGLVVLAAGLMAYVPHAARSRILVYVALKIFRLGEMIRIYREGGREILLVAASGGLVVALPIEIGMLLAIVLSFVYSLYVRSDPWRRHSFTHREGDPVYRAITPQIG